ncbi:glycosyltransferase family 2 protein [Candidatus Parcubacteria bacterium]|nr:glycosyltransferase family 2 protein [Candidatus Parcubacteria bacterium]
MKISLIIPIYNEDRNLNELFSKINSVLRDLNLDYEIIAIDDGSTDNSFNVLRELAGHDYKIKIINFRRNFGQTAAIFAGINYSKGDIIIPIDSDLENDPEDIPKLINKIKEGYDVVSGWRKDRWQGKFLTRKMPSAIANWLISKVTKIKLHDYGCTLKAYKREAVDNIHLYGEMHRFIPVYAALNGAKVSEIPVSYKPRKYGKSNYGLKRTFKVVLDLFTVVFLCKYFSRPMHFFGKFGFFLLFSGFLTGSFLMYLKIFKGVSFVSTPLPLLTVVLGIIGVQFILMGLLAEIIIRVYFEAQKKPTYLIKEKINF